MADSPYLVALCLFEQDGERALPLAGKSLSEVAAQSDTPRTEAHALALELLLRVWQRTDQGALKRSNGDQSLLIVELPMESLPEKLPALKAEWLKTGNTNSFQSGLRAIAGRGWTMSIKKFEPVNMRCW